MIYPFGSPVVLTMLKADGVTPAVLSDYATVTLHIAKPGSATETHTGAVSYTFLPTLEGRHASWWTTTGPTGATDPEPFDVEPAGVAPLVSLEDAKAHLEPLDVNDDDELHGFILAASALLLSHPDYRLDDVCSSTDHTEWVDAGSDTVVLKHYPVTAVTSVTEYAGTTAQVIAAEPLDGGTFTGYGWDYADGTGANGLLVRTSGGARVRWCGNRVKIVYTAGSVSVPSDVRLAVLDLVQFWWSQAKGAGTQSYGQPDFGMPSPFGIPNAVTDKLVNYKRGAQVA